MVLKSYFSSSIQLTETVPTSPSLPNSLRVLFVHSQTKLTRIFRRTHFLEEIAILNVTKQQIFRQETIKKPELTEVFSKSKELQKICFFDIQAQACSRPVYHENSF